MAAKFSPHYESILATSSKDRRVILWDLNKSSTTCQEASSELLFLHGGHKDTISDFDWNPAEPMEICSVGEDNYVHIWKIPVEEYV